MVVTGGWYGAVSGETMCHMSANDMSVQRPTSRYVATCRDISPTCRMTCRDISKCVIFKYADICHVKQHVGATICRDMSRDVADISIDMSRHVATCRDMSRHVVPHVAISVDMPRFNGHVGAT